MFFKNLDGNQVGSKFPYESSKERIKEPTTSNIRPMTSSASLKILTSAFNPLLRPYTAKTNYSIKKPKPQFYKTSKIKIKSLDKKLLPKPKISFSSEKLVQAYYAATDRFTQFNMQNEKNFYKVKYNDPDLLKISKSKNIDTLLRINAKLEPNGVANYLLRSRKQRIERPQGISKRVSLGNKKLMVEHNQEELNNDLQEIKSKVEPIVEECSMLRSEFYDENDPDIALIDDIIKRKNENSKIVKEEEEDAKVLEDHKNKVEGEIHVQENYTKQTKQPSTITLNIDGNFAPNLKAEIGDDSLNINFKKIPETKNISSNKPTITINNFSTNQFFIFDGTLRGTSLQSVNKNVSNKAMNEINIDSAFAKAFKNKMMMPCNIRITPQSIESKKETEKVPRNFPLLYLNKGNAYLKDLEMYPLTSQICMVQNDKVAYLSSEDEKDEKGNNQADQNNEVKTFEKESSTKFLLEKTKQSFRPTTAQVNIKEIANNSVPNKSKQYNLIIGASNCMQGCLRKRPITASSNNILKSNINSGSAQINPEHNKEQYSKYLKILGGGKSTFVFNPNSQKNIQLNKDIVKVNSLQNKEINQATIFYNVI